MRDAHGLHEVLLKARLDRGFDFLHPSHQLFDFRARAVVQQRNARAGAGRIARRGDLRQIAVGNHAEHHRVLDVDMTAEGARKADPVDLLGAQVLHQQLDAGIQRGLRELNRAHVVLRDL